MFIKPLTIKKLDKIAVFLIATKDYAFSVATTCLGLLDNNRKTRFAFYILHDGMSQEDRSALTNLLGDTNFILMDRDYFHNEVKTHLASRYDRNKIESLLDKRKLYFIAKPLCLKLLNKHKKVLFLDTDLLISGSLESIFQIEGVAWRDALVKAHEKLHLAYKRHQTYFGSMPEDFSAPNAGVMCFTNQIDYNGILEECLWVLQEYHDELRSDLDEAVIAWAVHKFYGKRSSLDHNFNQYIHHANNETTITHAIGKVKFWEANYRKIIFPDWNKYYHSWIKSGGSPHNKEAKDHSYIGNDDDRGRLCRFMFRSLIWENLYNLIGGDLPSQIYRAGPVAEVYSKLFVRNISKSIHFEISIAYAGDPAKFDVSFFIKNKIIINSDLLKISDELLNKHRFIISHRTDMLQIKSLIKVNDNMVSSRLSSLLEILQESGVKLEDIDEYLRTVRS